MSWLGKILGDRVPTRQWKIGVTLIPPVAADVRLTLSGATVVTGERQGDSGQYLFHFSTPTHKVKDAGMLYIQAAGYIEEAIEVPSIGPPDPQLGNVALVPVKPVRHHRPEDGLVVPDGRVLRREDGSVWDYRGASMFLALQRQMAGEDPRPTLDWLHSIGANVARVFAGPVGWSAVTVPGVPVEIHTRPDYQEQISRLLDVYAAAKIRVQLSVITGDDLSVEVWERILNQVYEAASGHWNALGEDCNEPWVGQKRAILDAIIARGQVNRHGILSAYGISPEMNPTPGAEDYLPCPFLDFGTAHLDREMNRYPRNGKELKEMADANPVYWIDDESRGVAEYHKDGSGARTNDLKSVLGHLGTSRLNGGNTIHSQCGLEGRPPAEWEPITAAICQAVGDMWELIPGDAFTGTYCAPHLTGDSKLPLAFSESDCILPPGASSYNGRAYGRRMGDRIWAVTPMTKPEWMPVPSDGWTVVKSICENTVHELQR